MQLEAKIYFYLLFLIPLMVVWFVWVQFWKKKSQRKFADKILFKKLSPDISVFKGVLKFMVLSLSIVFLIIGLVNPKLGTKLETVKREGVDLVFAVDVSKSMLAEDIAPNRLEKAKRLVSEIINGLVSDRIGIIAYAAQAHPQLPITTDYGAAKMFLQSMHTNMLSSQGTALNKAIKLATTYYNDEEQTNRVLLILSDGEDHVGGEAKKAVEKAVKEGIKIYTIGIGTPKGNRIPLKKRGVVESYKKDLEGNVVITKLQKELLSSIAKNGNGKYLDGIDTKATVETIKEELQKMDKKEFEAKQYAEFKDQFQWFLGFGLLFLFLDIFLLNRKTKWIQKLNLFNEKNAL